MPTNPTPVQPSVQAIPTKLGSDTADRTEVERLVGVVETERKSKVVVYWLMPMARISEAAVVPLYDQLLRIGKQQRLDIILNTTGGDTDAPWPIVSLIREYCDHFGVLIPHRAHSSGTLLALGADEIVMTPLSVLGPIDPQRTHPLLPKRTGADESEAISVQDMRHAMEFVRTAFGKETTYTPEAMASILTVLFEKVHPLAIGAIEQSYALAKLIATKCLGTHMDPVADKAVIESIANELCDSFKSHTYEINRREAKALKLKVTEASTTLEAALMEIWRFYVARPIAPPALPAAGRKVRLVIAWLDSLQLHQRVEGEFEVGQKPGELKPAGDRWVEY